MKYRKHILALALSSLLTSYAQADGLDSSMFNFSAFGTLAKVHSSEEQADFTSSYFKPDGAGHSDNWALDVDSSIGAQIQFRPTSTLSAMVQVIAQQDYNDTWHPHLEWAYINYSPTRELSLRAGQIELPSFLFSDTINIGYSMPWERAPVELYHLIPITHNDGIDLDYRLNTGSVLQTFSLVYGRDDPRLPHDVGIAPVTGGTAHGRNMWLVGDKIEYGAATFHAAYQSINATISSFSPLFDALSQFGPEGESLAAQYTPVGKHVNFYGFGAQYDPGQWFVAGEWGEINFHSMLGETKAWYLSGGYRFGQVTPYLTWGGSSVLSNTSTHGIDTSMLPPQYAYEAMALNAGLNAALASASDETTLSAGLRWDFYRNLALKFQYDHIRMGADSHGLLINLQPGYQYGGVVNLMSVSLNFVL